MTRQTEWGRIQGSVKGCQGQPLALEGRGMKVEIEGLGTFMADWKHEVYDEDDPAFLGDEDGPRVAIKSKTTCIISVNGMTAAMGYANCGMKDQFNKETGRKISLTRALILLPLFLVAEKKDDANEVKAVLLREKELRSAFWMAYFAMRPTKSKNPCPKGVETCGI